MAQNPMSSVLSILAVLQAANAQFSNVSNAIPQLQGLKQLPDSSRPMTLGGQSWTHCCLLAINASFQVNHQQNDSLEYTSRPFLDAAAVTPSDFADYAAKAAGAFPCGAQFDGNMAGAPSVQVPYSWCESNCYGWQISHRSNPTQWIGPLVGFILPCLAFCLNIPRRCKLSIPPWVFSPSPTKFRGILLSIPRLAIALFLAALDTVGWLCICFALAGPMLLSGVYETWIDMRLLKYLWKEIIIDSNMEDELRTNQVLTMKLRAQLLLLIVVGNIDIAPSSEKQGVYPEVLNVVRGLERNDQNRASNVVKVKSRLLALCSSQNSFGSAVGAPVVFFVGAFVYNLIDIQARLGDNDTAHALAFGMWWMTIPFIAIISCLLLASNNPGSLHGILATETRATPTWKIFEGAYGGPYEPVNLWGRGPSKMYWFDQTIEQYEAAEDFIPPTQGHPLQNLHPGTGRPQAYTHYPPGYPPYGLAPHPPHPPHPPNPPPHPDIAPSISQVSESSAYSRKGQLGRLKLRMKPHKRTWLAIFMAAVIPLATSASLACLTSYTTPRVGLGCRSLTHVCYFVTQLVQMVIWMCCDRVIVDEESVPDGRFWMKRGAWMALKIFVGSIAAFVSIGGTLMQILGVYRNCLCKISAWYWLRTDHPDAWVDLGQNTALSIRNAQLYWIPMAFTATGTLCVTCALAWWFQRHLRDRYKGLVEKIEVNPSW